MLVAPKWTSADRKPWYKVAKPRAGDEVRGGEVPGDSRAGLAHPAVEVPSFEDSPPHRAPVHGGPDLTQEA